MLSDESDAAYAKLLNASSAYLHLATVFGGLLRKAAESGESPDEVVHEGIREYAKLFDLGNETVDRPEARGSFADKSAWEWAEKWGVPADAWEKFFNVTSGLPDHVSEAMGAAGPFAEVLRHRFDDSAGGFAQGHGERFRRWTELNAESVDAGLEYARFLGRTHARALEKMAARLASFETAEEEDPGEDSRTMRRLYDLCVDCGEAAYAELAADQGYLNAQARVTNALVALRNHEQQGFQEWLTTMRVTGRRELGAVVRRLQAVRRELRDLKDRMEGLEERLGGVDQCAVLRKELARLRARDRQRDVEWAALNESLEKLRADMEKRIGAAPTGEAPAKKRSTGKRAGTTAVGKARSGTKV